MEMEEMIVVRKAPKKPKRIRKSNWSREETDILVSEVDAARHLLHGKNYPDGSRINPQEKFKGWAMVTHKVNSVAPCKRTVSEVRKKWHDIKFMARRKEEIFTRQEAKNGAHENTSSNHSDVSSLSKPSWETADNSQTALDDTDTVANMNFYLDCMETFQQDSASDNDEASEPGYEEANIPSSSNQSSVPTNLELIDQVRLLQGNNWTAKSDVPTVIKANDYSEKLLEIEKEKLKVKKEKLQVLKDMLKVQKERLEFEKLKQRQNILLVQPTDKSNTANNFHS